MVDVGFTEILGKELLKCYCAFVSMDKNKGLKDRVVEFLMISTMFFSVIVLIGIKLNSIVILSILGGGLGYITVLHVVSFFQKMNTNIREIKNYIKGEPIVEEEKNDAKMNKKGKIRWLVIIWSVIIGLALFLLFKTLFGL